MNTCIRLLSVLSVLSCVWATVIGIDYGSEMFKVTHT